MSVTLSCGIAGKRGINLLCIIDTCVIIGWQQQEQVLIGLFKICDQQWLDCTGSTGFLSVLFIGFFDEHFHPLTDLENFSLNLLGSHLIDGLKLVVFTHD